MGATMTKPMSAIIAHEAICSAFATAATPNNKTNRNSSAHAKNITWHVTSSNSGLGKDLVISVPGNRSFVVDC